MSITPILWFLIGVAIAMVNYITRLWTVLRIQPRQKLRGMILVFVGAFFRLVIVGFSIYQALQVNIFSALSFFVGLWIMRWVLAFTNGLNILGSPIKRFGVK